MSIIVLIMRGHDLHQDAMFSYLSPEQRVPQDHPLRPIRRMTDQALQRLSPRFERMYADIGRPSIAPEKLLRALLLQAALSPSAANGCCWSNSITTSCYGGLWD